jgi:hypothetical protein
MGCNKDSVLTLLLDAIAQATNELNMERVTLLSQAYQRIASVSA